MVRERVGDWRLAWRFALAGLVAGLLVIALVQTAITAGNVETGEPTAQPLTDAIRNAGNVVLACTVDDAPKGEFSTVAAAVGERGLGAPDHANAVRGTVLRPATNATCPENEADEPGFLLALRVASGINSPRSLKG